MTKKAVKKEGITPENLPVLAKVFSYERYEDIDTKRVASELGVSQQRVAGMVRLARDDPGFWDEAKKAYGYHDDQKPAWVGAGKASVGSVGSVDTPGSRKARRTVAPSKLGQEKRPTVPTVSTAPVDTPASSAPQTAQAAAFDAANKVLGPGGQRIEALGSDALQNWMQENAVEEMNGSYWQKRVLPSGEMALVEVKPPREVLEAEQLGNAELSSMMYRSLEGETAALMKKVAFNPEAFTYYSWAKRKGMLGPNKDFADFLNYCVVLTMTKIFGARIGVIINTDNTLIGMLKERRANTEVEYTT